MRPVLRLPSSEVGFSLPTPGDEFAGPVSSKSQHLAGVLPGAHQGILREAGAVHDDFLLDFHSRNALTISPPGSTVWDARCGKSIANLGDLPNVFIEHAFTGRSSLCVG
jgi:hypothetical protein